nr:phage holin family protein [uncultured Pantoea sp.]
MTIHCDPQTLLVIAFSAAIALRLMLFSKKGRTHKPLISWLAAGLIVAYGNFVLLWLFGLYRAAGWPIVISHALVCIVVFIARGNVSRIFSYPTRSNSGE